MVGEAERKKNTEEKKEEEEHKREREKKERKMRNKGTILTQWNTVHPPFNDVYGKR